MEERRSAKKLLDCEKEVNEKFTKATGRPASLRVLGRLLERLVGHEEFRFAQCSEVATWRLNPAAG